MNWLGLTREDGCFLEKCIDEDKACKFQLYIQNGDCIGIIKPGSDFPGYPDCATDDCLNAVKNWADEVLQNYFQNLGG